MDENDKISFWARLIDWKASPILKFFLIRHLLKKLKEDGSFEKAFSIEALGDMKDTRVVPALIEALKDEDVNIIAARTLGKIGQASAATGLVFNLCHEDKDVKMAAAEALVSILRQCNTTGKLREFENKLNEGFFKLKSIDREKDEIRKIGFRIAELKNEIAKKRDMLEKDKDVLLVDPPKPPKKGSIFRLSAKSAIRS